MTMNFGWGKCESEYYLVNKKRFNLWIVCNQGQSTIVNNCDRSRIVYNCITPSWIKRVEFTFYFPSTSGTLLDSVFHLCWRQISENKLSNHWKYLRSAYLENQLNLFPREVLWGLIYRITLWIHICLLNLLFTVFVVTIKSQGRRKVRKNWKYLHKLLSCDKTILVPVKELKSQSDIQHPNHEWCPHKISEFSSSSEFCITP